MIGLWPYLASLVRKPVAGDEPPVSMLAGTATEIATREIGSGEEGSNNRGPHVERYGQTKGGAWCAAFVGYCYAESGKLVGEELPFKRSLGAKRIWRNAGRAGVFVEQPQAGDVVCWDRGKKGSWQGHVGIVSRVHGSTFWSIEGNRGRFPSVVAEYRHELDEGRLMGFARI